MQSLKKGDQRRGLRWTQVLSIRGHVPAALNHLSNELVLREPHCHAVESGSSLSTTLSKGMTITTLLHLKDERALPLKRGGVMNVSLRHRIAAPGIHVRTPGRVSREMGERAECDRDQQDRQDRNRAALPTLFPFTGKKREKQQPDNHQDRTDQKSRCLKRGRKQ